MADSYATTLKKPAPARPAPAEEVVQEIEVEDLTLRLSPSPEKKPKKRYDSFILHA